MNDIQVTLHHLYAAGIGSQIKTHKQTVCYTTLR